MATWSLRATLLGRTRADAIARKAPQFQVMFRNIFAAPIAGGLDGVMVIEQHGSHSACRVAILSGVIAAAIAMPRPASAQGFFDFVRRLSTTSAATGKPSGAAGTRHRARG